MIDSLLNLVKKNLHRHWPEIQNTTTNQRHQYITLRIPIKNPVSLQPVEINDSFFLSKPDSGLILLGLGSFLSITAAGQQRFADIKSQYLEILANWLAKEVISPIAFHAFAFDDNDSMSDCWSGFPNTIITFPSLLFKQENNQQILLLNIKKNESTLNDTFFSMKKLLEEYFKKLSQPFNTLQKPALMTSHETHDWFSLTKNAITAIQSGPIDKIVTSRQLSLTQEKNISTPHLIQQLIKNYPGCTILSYHRSDKTIVVASPERLLSLNHPAIQSDAIGGTIHRNSSQKIPSDFNEEVLLSSPPLPHNKRLLKEHDYIVQAIYQGLDTLCHSLKMPVSPFLMKLHNMYHFETPLQGRLMDQYDIFDVIQTLHPTPAVSGYPTKKAQQWLLDNENYQRGWYTGAFGYIEEDSQAKINGELSVMLRCAVINKNQITLFAGAGLVAESDPEIEWHETELKMQTILEVL